MKKILLFLSYFLCVSNMFSQNTISLEYSINKQDLTATVISSSGWHVPGSIVIPSTYEEQGITYQVIAIGERAFFSCSGLTSITLPKSIITIGENAFDECTRLTSINIPDNVTTIGKSAFEGCPLTSITLPAKLTSIESKIFAYCSHLSSITIPENITKIETDAFFSCTNLTSVTLPSSLKTIEYDAFMRCPLEHVYCFATEPPTYNGTSFISGNNKCTLHIPHGCLSNYTNASIAKGFTTIIDDIFPTNIELTTTEKNATVDIRYLTLDGKPANAQTKGTLIKQTLSKDKIVNTEKIRN